MKRMFLILSALLALLGLALAGEAYDVGEVEATVTERINLTIPQRVALHLTEDEWVLDLNNPPLGNLETGEGCFLVPKGFQGTPQDALNAALNGTLRPIAAYPAAQDFNGNGKLEDDEKGTLICINKKILQKFSNDEDGWELSVSVTGTPGSGFGYFVLADFISSTLAGSFATNRLPFGPVPVASESGTTGGWLDDTVVEAFWFDGSELDGTYTIDVTFTLAGL